MKADPRRRNLSPRDRAIRDLNISCDQLGFRLMDNYQAYRAGYHDATGPHYEFYVAQLGSEAEILAKGTLEDIQDFVKRCENLKVFL